MAHGRGLRSVSGVPISPAVEPEMLPSHTRGLTKRYGATVAVDGLDLDARAAEVYGFLGPNGAGKATTIRLLLGLHRSSAGAAEIFGADVAGRCLAVRSPRADPGKRVSSRVRRGDRPSSASPARWSPAGCSPGVTSPSATDIS
jgi:hypothetical protein